MITDFDARGGEVIDLVALNLGEGVAAGNGAVNAVGPVFEDFKAARISDNADGHAVITLGAIGSPCSGTPAMTLRLPISLLSR